MQKEILYPKDMKLKRAFQALIKLVLKTGRVRHQTETATRAIMEEMEMVDDTSANPKKVGTSYKKALNYLKTLRAYARLVPGTFGVVEIFIFTADKRRVQTLDRLQEICSRDPDLQDMPTTQDGFDYSQQWIPQPRIIAEHDDACAPRVLSEIATIDTAIARKQAAVREAAPKKRHAGVFKGCEDMKTTKSAVIPRKMRVRASKTSKQTGAPETIAHEESDLYNRNALAEHA